MLPFTNPSALEVEMRAFWCLLVVSLACLSGFMARAQDRPIVAVFDIEDTREKKVQLAPEKLRSLTDYLSNKLAIGGKFKIVPRANVYGALQAKKSESYKECYDEACQIEIGKEVAAQKSLATKIDQLGAECIVTSTLFDLRQSATENSASYRGPCGQSELLTAVEQIAARLRGETGGGVQKAGIRFDTSDLPAVPSLELPAEGGTAASGVDFGDVDVNAMELYDAAVQGEKDESVAISQKIVRWQQVQKKAPKFRAHATGRIVAWQEHARKKQQVDAVQKKRAARMMKDWEKLARLLKLKVISDEDREAWSEAFYQAYEVEARDNPFARDAKVVEFLAAVTEKKRKAEEERRSAELRLAEEKQLAVDKRLAEEKRLADEKRRADEARTLAEQLRASIAWVFSRPAGIELMKTEVTVALYRACVKAGKCSPPSRHEQCNWDMAGGEQHPINCVDWNQAMAFCEFVGGRLPSEEEWYAEASDGGKRQYPWGDQDVSCELAIFNWSQPGKGCGKNSTWPVCSKPAGNSLSGLCDMCGNVREWTSSSNGSYGAMRGGSWSGTFRGDLRAAYRCEAIPEGRNSDFGFRCARSVKP
jgi:iron(II)-dependent oxidoreductase